jgi:L-seryl-tRNA(Ser) seleniumtransferase
MSVYDELGVRRVINAATTLTVVGGSLMPEAVLEAMREAAQSYVDMHELHRAAGQRLAELTHNEAAYVTPGGAAALVLGILGAITRGDPGAISRMPDGDGLPTDVIIHAAHRIPYDPAIRLAGGRLVQIGNVEQTFEWELESALSDRTAAVVWVAGSHLPQGGALDLGKTVRLAHAHHVPVLVDAAAQLPPPENLWHFTGEVGADAAIFSGGKGLHGPQASGLMVGSRAFIEAARANGAPYQRLARAMKVGKEEIIGLVQAVEIFLAQDWDGLSVSWERTVSEWVETLSAVPGLTATRSFPNQAGQPVPRVLVYVDPEHSGCTADQVLAALWDGEPRILALRGARETFYLTPDTLVPGEAAIVASRIVEVVRSLKPLPPATAAQ